MDIASTKESISKQNPMPPIHEFGKGKGDRHLCPRCNSRVSAVFKDNYCSRCGQAIKWDK